MTRSRLLFRCQNGITAIEFALIAPVFMMLIMGIVEFAMIMFTSIVLESATNNTSRLGKTGYVASGSSRQQQIINNVNLKTAGFLDAGKITLTSKVYSDFDDIGKPEPCVSPAAPPCPGTPGVNFVDINGSGSWDSDMGQAGLGNAGDVVVYTVSYPWPIMTPIIGALIGNTFAISARTVVRNEPFSSAGR